MRKIRRQGKTKIDQGTYNNKFLSLNKVSYCCWDDDGTFFPTICLQSSVVYIPNINKIGTFGICNNTLFIASRLLYIRCYSMPKARGLYIYTAPHVLDAGRPIVYELHLFFPFDLFNTPNSLKSRKGVGWGSERIHPIAWLQSTILHVYGRAKLRCIDRVVASHFK